MAQPATPDYGLVRSKHPMCSCRLEEVIDSIDALQHPESTQPVAKLKDLLRSFKFAVFDLHVGA